MSKVKLFHNDRPINITLPAASNRTVSLVDYISENCPSLVGPNAIYHPTPYLLNGHLQTAYAAYYTHSPTVNAVHYERELFTTADGGTIALDWSPKKDGLENDSTPTLVILHGLTGGSYESYIRSLLEVITYPPFSYRAVVLNSRGCANSEITTPQMYSGGYTEDLRAALVHIQRRLGPNTPLIGLGFSLGSNILVKYLGEEGDKTPFKAAISVANPYDFRLSMDRICESYIGRYVYSSIMTKNLKATTAKHFEILTKNGAIDPDEVMSARTIREFDDACTRKMFGYTTVNNYYRDASSCRFIEHVKIPLLCLNALDDPIAPAQCIPYDEIKINPHVVLVTTDRGGHIGWFEGFRHPTRWVVKPLAEFIVAMFKAHDVRQIEAQLDAQTIDNIIDSKNETRAGNQEKLK